MGLGLGLVLGIRVGDKGEGYVSAALGALRRRAPAAQSLPSTVPTEKGVVV